jgi:hypothetical protein
MDAMQGMTMTKIVAKLGAAAAAVVLVTGLGGLAMAQTAPGPEGYTQQGSPDAAGPSGATRALEVPLLYVNSIEIIATQADPKLVLVRVTGLASSPGWTAPELVPFFYGKPADGVLDLQFIATSPEQSQKADGFEPMTALFTLDTSNPFKGVRVRADANAIEVDKMTGFVQTQIKANDGRDLIGKKFVESGPAGAGVVTGADLPKGYRTIMPTHGVAGITHNPNRLNLILDSGSKIVMAFWE